MNHKTTNKDRHKMATITCNMCHSTYSRKVVTIKRIGTTCQICLLKSRPKVQSFTTRKLKEIIHNNGVTDYGSDYENSLLDIKEELYKREEKIMQKEFDKQEPPY